MSARRGTTPTGSTVPAPPGRACGMPTIRRRSCSTPWRGRSSSRRGSIARPPGARARTWGRRRWVSCRDRGRAPTAVPDRTPPLQPDTAIIYEMHVRGFTRNPNSGVPPERRGTFAGVIDKIPYLKELGITMVELLPVQQFDPQEGNYWGYMTLNFFAPHAGYASDARAARDEFRAMVRALHAADIAGHPRRRLQPHGRGRPGRADLQLPGDRQRRLLRDVRRPAGDVPRLHRLRQHAGLRQHLHLDVDPREPALLGDGDARRRLPLRPGLGAGPRPRRHVRDGRHLAAGRHPHRPGPAPRPPDRRALGCRLGLPARDPVPRAGVVPVERPVPRRRPPVRPRRSRAWSGR